jgi:hypothetical protein
VAGRALLKIVYVLAWRTLDLVVVLFRGDQVATAEVLVLRHEKAVLRLQARWVRYEPSGPGLVWCGRSGRARRAGRASRTRGTAR